MPPAWCFMQIRANTFNYWQIALDPGLVTFVCVLSFFFKEIKTDPTHDREKGKRERERECKPTEKSCMMLVNRQKTISKGQKSPVTSQRVTTGGECVMCTNCFVEQQGKHNRVPDGWDQPDRMVQPDVWCHRGVKTNTKNCLQVLFV